MWLVPGMFLHDLHDSISVPLLSCFQFICHDWYDLGGPQKSWLHGAHTYPHAHLHTHILYILTYTRANAQIQTCTHIKYMYCMHASLAYTISTNCAWYLKDMEQWDKTCMTNDTVLHNTRQSIHTYTTTCITAHNTIIYLHKFHWAKAGSERSELWIFRQ